MGARGRPSGSELSVVSSNIVAIERPRPPLDLTEEQARIWKSIVESEPADWFTPATLQMLSQLSIHISRARRLARLLNDMEGAVEVDVKEYRDLLRSEEEQSRAIASLATKMRLSQQATYDRKKAKGAGGRRPWEFEG